MKRPELHAVTINETEYHDLVDPLLEKAAASFKPRNHTWTPRDIALLRRYYNRVPIELLAQQLGRSVGAVQNAATRHCIVQPRGGER